jgi:uncharacterized protein YceH (UPF0502 family)
LRTRTNRLCSFTDVKEVETILDGLANREIGPLVVKLPREPGKRESRYQHLFSGEVDVESLDQTFAHAHEGGATARIDQLEHEVHALKNEVAELRALVESLL